MRGRARGRISARVTFSVRSRVRVRVTKRIASGSAHFHWIRACSHFHRSARLLALVLSLKMTMSLNQTLMLTLTLNTGLATSVIALLRRYARNMVTVPATLIVSANCNSSGNLIANPDRTVNRKVKPEP